MAKLRLNLAETKSTNSASSYADITRSFKDPTVSAALADEITQSLNLKYQVFVTKSVNDLSFRSMKRVFAMLRRNVPFHTNTSVKCMLIRMCVLSQIFYACQVVNFSQEWLRRLHSLQRRCLRWSVSATCSFSCNLAVANMLPISYQLAFIDLVFLNKSLNGTIDFDIRNYVSVIYPPANLRSANVPYFQVRARYNCKNFFDRVCVLANSCHNAGIVIPSPPDSFKRQLKISMTRTLASTFDSGLYFKPLYVTR